MSIIDEDTIEVIPNTDTMELPKLDSGSSEGSYDSDEILNIKRKIGSLDKENIELKNKISSLLFQTKQLDEKVFDLFTISQAGKVFTATPDIDRLSEILLFMIIERLQLDKAALLLHDTKANTFWVSNSLGLPGDVKGVKYNPKEGLFWQLIVNGDPFSVVDIEGNLRFNSVFKGSELSKLESKTWVPMKTKDRIVGIITLGDGNVSHHDLDYLVQLAGQAAVSFETAFLYKELRESRRELDRQMHNLSMLYEIGKAMNYIEDLNKLLVQILDQAIEVVNASKGSLMLLETGELNVRVVRGIDKMTEDKIISGEIQCTKIRLGEGVAGKVAATGEPMLIEDAASDNRFMASHKSNVKNLLCVSIKKYDEIIGVINMTNKKGGVPFNEEDLKIITTLADQAAVAISNARLYEMAVTDGMTKLFIRRHFMQTLESEVQRTMRYGHTLSLLMIDIDHFKRLNDTYGHQAGDKVLIEVAKIFKRSIRTTDMAARYGGEEFCILLPETPIAGALVIGDRLRKEVENCVVKYQDIEIKCTISVGTGTMPNDAETPQELIRKADMALYQSKKSGRNRVTSYSEPEVVETVSKNGRKKGKKHKVNDIPDIETINGENKENKDCLINNSSGKKKKDINKDKDNKKN